MSLQDYTTAELKAELKRRADLAKTEKARVKRCRMCKHWGVVDYTGKPLSESEIEWRKKLNYSKPCKFFLCKSGKYFLSHVPSQPACEHFEPINND